MSVNNCSTRTSQCLPEEYPSSICKSQAPTVTCCMNTLINFPQTISPHLHNISAIGTLQVPILRPAFRGLDEDLAG